jgi:predicted ester cyclase
MSTATIQSISDDAFAFFDACETGKGWEACRGYCHENATFSCQSGALAEVTTLADYCDWMKGMFVPMPNGSYELTAFATDEKRNRVVAAAVFSGTNTAEGGPVPPTGKSTASDYAYIIDFNDGKISQMTKIWNDGFALSELGWV